MRGLIEHGAFVLAVTCLAAAGLRVASAAGAQGVLRVLAAAVVAVAAAVLETLELGLIGLSGSAPALLGAAVLTWAAARAALPPAESRIVAELEDWWRSATRSAQAAAGAGAVLALGWTVWQLRYPYIGVDGLLYHMPLASEYAQAGRAAALTPVFDALPVENYPVTNEVALSWVLGLSGSWVVASVCNPALMVMLVAAGRVGLRELAVPARTAWLAVAALATLPLTATELGGPGTDLAAVAWLAVAAALAAASRANPRLLSLAVVAAGLSFGTKTTPAVVLACVLGAAAWAARRSLRTVARPLALGVIAAVGVGGIWSIRNTVLHGSPLWPLMATPFGDPLPPVLVPVRDSFLSHPGAMLDGRVSDYLRVLEGGAVTLSAGLLAPLLGRSRPTALASLLVLVAALVWGVAPYTGVADNTELAVAALRYLLPCLAVSCVALALAGRDGGRRARLVVDAVLGLAVLLSVQRVVRLGFPAVPSAATITGLLALGAAAGLLARAPVAVILRLRAARATVAAALSLLAVVGLNGAAQGYVARHADVGLADGALLAAAEASPGWADGSFPIAMGPAVNALLAGDRLAHRVELLGGMTSCAEVRRREAAGWIVLSRLPPSPVYAKLRACLGAQRPVRTVDRYEIFAG